MDGIKAAGRKESWQRIGPKVVLFPINVIDLGCSQLYIVLIEDIVLDSGHAGSTRGCATAGVKDKVVDETPLEKEEHSYFRTVSLSDEARPAVRC